MPRLSVDKQTAMLQSVRRHILGYKAERLAAGSDCHKTAAALGFETPTMYKRIKHPETLTFVEVLRIANTLNISVSTLLGEREVTT